jgi:hypothetical protein
MLINLGIELLVRGVIKVRMRRLVLSAPPPKGAEMTDKTKPCSFCKKPIPDSGVFGLPTYTDVPENHSQDCPIREVMLVGGLPDLEISKEERTKRVVDELNKAFPEDEDLGLLLEYLLERYHELIKCDCGRPAYIKIICNICDRDE